MAAADVKKQLELLNIRANPALGQNFLCDDAAIAAIASAAAGSGELELLEIGPGLGALTAALLERAPRVTAVEIDNAMVAALNSAFAAQVAAQKLNVVHCDILKFSLSAMPASFAAAGNLPYYITTPITLRLLENAKSIPRMVLMVQKEAARRFFAQPGDKLYGPLAIMAQLYYAPQSLLALTPASYYPQPDVDSEVIRLDRRADISACPAPAEFLRFLAAIFSMRRKTLYNNIKPLLPSAAAASAALERAGIAPSVRAEALSISELVALYFECCPQA